MSVIACSCISIDWQWLAALLGSWMRFYSGNGMVVVIDKALLGFELHNRRGLRGNVKLRAWVRPMYVELG